MYNVASQALCEELAELSGWRETRSMVAKTWSTNGVGKWFVETAYHGVLRGQIQAYDLGYLLRKLHDQSPSVQYVDANNPGSMDLKKWYDKWIAYVPYQAQGVYLFADSPEDAVVMLAIKLFEVGILTKEVK